MLCIMHLARNPNVCEDILNNCMCVQPRARCAVCVLCAEASAGTDLRLKLRSLN